MQAAQHVRHLEVGAGHVGDGVQRALQLLRLLQALDAFPHAAHVEGFAQARDRRGAQVDRGVRAVEHRHGAFAVVVEHARAAVVVLAGADAGDRVDGVGDDPGVGARGREGLDVPRPMGRPEDAGAMRIELRVGLEPGLHHGLRGRRAQQPVGQRKLRRTLMRRRSTEFHDHGTWFPLARQRRTGRGPIPCAASLCWCNARLGG